MSGEVEGSGQLANVTRSGVTAVGHGIYAQLGESDRSRKGVSFGTGSRLWLVAACADRGGRHARSREARAYGSLHPIADDEMPSPARAYQGSLELLHPCDATCIAAQEGETTLYLHPDGQSWQKTMAHGQRRDRESEDRRRR
jgi:hypothetical protein